MSEAEPPPTWVSAPSRLAAATEASSERTEKAVVEWYWSAARAKRYQTLAASGSSTASTKVAASPQWRKRKRAGSAPLGVTLAAGRGRRRRRRLGGRLGHAGGLG